MEDDTICDFGGNALEIQNLNDIRKRPDIISKIKFDVTPRIIMEPRFHSNPDDLQKLRQMSGYMFYVESQCEPPALMVLKVGKIDFTSTVGKIDNIPQELVRKAIENPSDVPSNGMYAITEDIKEWLKKELSL